jgi:hypothetical protein
MWCNVCRQRRRFGRWSYDELLSEAFIHAERLLRDVYDPEKAKVSTFLGSYLWGAVHYTYWIQHGFRFRHVQQDGGKRRKAIEPRIKIADLEDFDAASPVPSEEPSVFDCPELSDSDKLVMRFLMDGHNAVQTAAALGEKPYAVYKRLDSIREKLTRCGFE